MGHSSCFSSISLKKPNKRKTTAVFEPATKQAIKIVGGQLATSIKYVSSKFLLYGTAIAIYGAPLFYYTNGFNAPTINVVQTMKIAIWMIIVLIIHVAINRILKTRSAILEQQQHNNKPEDDDPLWKSPTHESDVATRDYVNQQNQLRYRHDAEMALRKLTPRSQFEIIQAIESHDLAWLLEYKYTEYTKRKNTEMYDDFDLDKFVEMTQDHLDHLEQNRENTK